MSKETNYFINGNKIALANSGTSILNRLPVGIYKFKDISQSDNPDVVLELQRGLDISVPEEIYGDVRKNVDDIFLLWNDRKKTTGISVTGGTGSGKTLYVRLVIRRALDQGIPVIIFGDCPYPDATRILERDLGKVVVIFDSLDTLFTDSGEVEKCLANYLDGVGNNNVLNIITVLEGGDINLPDMLSSRPDRIYRNYPTEEVDYPTLEKMIRSRVKGKRKQNELIEYTSFVKNISYEIVLRIIAEVNRGVVTPRHAVSKAAYSYNWFTPDDIRYDRYLISEDTNLRTEYFVRYKGKNVNISHLVLHVANTADSIRNMNTFYLEVPLEVDHPDYEKYLRGYTSIKCDISADKVCRDQVVKITRDRLEVKMNLLSNSLDDKDLKPRLVTMVIYRDGKF